MVPPRRNLPWPSLAIVATGWLSMGPVGILAQATTDVVCLSSFGSLNNSLSQNPCLVAAYLQSVCNGGQFDISALPVDTHYTGPYEDEDNQCQCSSVTYNTVSACGLCQNRTIISWGSWKSNCSTVYTGIFIPDVPVGTAIPHWAFQDVAASNGMFNLTIAQLAGDFPESTATHVQSTVASLTPTSTDDSTSLTPAPTLPSGSKSDAGAIAGGVVGGVVGAALIAAAIFFAIRSKKRSQIPPSAEFTAAQTSPPVASAGFTDINSLVPPMPPPRLYDPSDPSTFPASPPPTTIRTASSNAVSDDPRYSTVSVQPGGRYSGMPEV